MSDIETNLQKILSATYGKDVRQAIHDSIHDCYEDGKAGATDLVARERINNIVTNGGIEGLETVLYASNDPVYTGQITLSDDPSEYDYIKFIWKHRYNIATQEFPADQLTSSIYLRDTTNSSSNYEMCTLIVSGVSGEPKNRVLSGSVYDSTGYASGSITSDMNTGILTIIGVKKSEDELTDIRIGADGTTYSSAGEAVRTQIAIAKSSGLKDTVKQALLNLLEHVAYIDADGQDYYDELYNALYDKDVVSISAVFNQDSAVIYDTDSLDDLKQYLTVTALYSDGTTSPVSGYTLSGELTKGTSVITVVYDGKTTSFTVIVSSDIPTDYTWLYKASDGALLSARTDLVTPTIGTGCTETLVDGLLHLFVPLNSAEFIRYRLVQVTNNNAKLTAKVKFSSIGYAVYGTGFRLQVSNGTNGGQIFEHCDRDGSNCYFGTYEGNAYTNKLAFDLDTWHIISVEQNNGKQIVTVDGTEILNSSTLSTNYCASNAIFAQNAEGSNTDFNVDIEWITYKNND